MLIAHRSSWAAIFCHPECSKASVTSYNDRAFIISVPEWGFYEEQFRVAYRYKTFRHSLRLTKMLLSKQQCQPTVCPLQSKAFEWLRLIEWIIYGVSGPVWPAGSRHHEFTQAALILGWRDPTPVMPLQQMLLVFGQNIVDRFSQCFFFLWNIFELNNYFADELFGFTFMFVLW